MKNADLVFKTFDWEDLDGKIVKLSVAKDGNVRMVVAQDQETLKVYILHTEIGDQK